MNITFTPEPIPELTINGDALSQLDFTSGVPIQLTLRPDGLWITAVTDGATWEVLYEVSKYRQDLGADWVRDNGELIIGGNMEGFRLDNTTPGQGRGSVLVQKIR